jgi:hypothetical protein
MYVNLTVPTYDELSIKYLAQLGNHSGGRWTPKDCNSRHKVAIIVPYRDREPHLKLFLNHMHSFLQQQSIEYSIYIIEEVSF